MGRIRGSTSEKAERRLSLVTTKMSLGWTPGEVRDYLRDSEGLSRAQSERYVTDARQFFRKKAHADREFAHGLTLERLDLIFKKAVEAAQFGAALAAQRETINLLGLGGLLFAYHPEEEKKVKPTLLGEIAARMDSAQRERLIQQLKHFNAFLMEFSPSEQAKLLNGMKATLLSVKAKTAAPGKESIAGDAGAATPTPTAPEGSLKAPGGAPHPKQDILGALKGAT